MDIANAIMDRELGRSAFTVERLTYTVKIKGKSGTTALVDTGQQYNDFDFALGDK